MHPQNRSAHPVDCRIYALITCLLWSTSPAFLRHAMASFTPLSLSLFRLLLAAGSLILIGCIKKIGLPRLRDIPFFFLTGLLGFGGYFFIYNLGTERVPSGLNSLILAISPVIVAILSNAIYKERLGRVKWLAVAIELGGLAILAIFDGLLALNTGVLYLLGAAMLMSAYNLVQHKMHRGYGPLQFVTYSIIAGAIWQLGLLPELIPQVAAAQPLDLLLIVFTAVCATAIAYLLWGTALEIAPKASDVTNFMFLTPILSTLVGWLCNGEIPSLSTLCGGLVVLAGMAIFNFVPALPPHPHSKEKRVSYHA